MSILNIIDKDKNLRKLFGKREIVIIKKQLLGVPLKGSERTRLSRDIKKKLKAVKELARFVSEFDLKKGTEIKKMIEETKEVMFQNKLFSHIEKISLFGSIVENKSTLNSDIDIVVKFSKINKEEATNFRRDIMSRINERVDVQVYNFLPNKIKREILKKEKVLYEQKNQR